MRWIALALIACLFASPALALDWEIHTATQAQMLAVAKAIDAHTTITDVNGNATDINAEGFLNDGTRFSLYYEGRRFAPTGATTTDANGNTVPVMAALPGFYLIARITDNRQMPPAGVTLPNGVTVVPRPDTSPGFL